MFDHEEESTSNRTLRSCWVESAQLFQLVDSMPNLEHICFFADASDDTTLALLFSSLIEHPSHFPPPPVTAPSSPSMDPAKPPIPFIDRLRSLSWRQRADPPAGFKRFYQASTFVSTFHLLRHAHRLSFLVLDADMDEMGKEDVCTALKELKLRRDPADRRASDVSLMLCGPIRGWEDGFLQDMVDSFRGVKELFIDRPLYKSKEAHGTTPEIFVSLGRPSSCSYRCCRHCRSCPICNYFKSAATPLHPVCRLRSCWISRSSITASWWWACSENRAIPTGGASGDAIQRQRGLPCRRARRSSCCFRGMICA